MTRQEMGRKGGRATVARHGRVHMIAIGRKGFLATCARHWQGDRRGMMAWLRARARLAVAEALADIELRRRLDAGAVVACVELPD